MVQNDFFNNEEDLVLDLTKKQNNYFDSQGAELLAKSFFSYYKCEVFSAPESNLVDFLIKHNDKYIGIQVKSSSYRKKENVYKFETRRKNISYRTNGSKVLSGWKNYPYKDVQIFVFVANDIRKIYLEINDESKKTLRLKREDFLKFEENEEYFIKQIMSSLDLNGL
tara:strand:- start:35 stop:535 length:501 start_codon:yes stop_codon:yes gene_type:complete